MRIPGRTDSFVVPNVRFFVAVYVLNRSTV